MVGEKFVTPGCFIQFIVKLRIPDIGTPGSSTIVDQANGHANGSSAVSSGVAAPEAEIDELIGRRKKGADGEKTSPWAHAPYFPTVSLCSVIS